MNVIVIFIFGFILIGPFLTLGHEIFHALPSLIFTSNKILISLGSTVGDISFNIGRLEFAISNWPKPWVGFCRYGLLPANLNFLALALGPLFSFTIALFSFLAIKTRVFSPFSRSILYFIIGWTFFQFSFTLMPIKYPIWLGYSEYYSDGMNIIKVLAK